MDFVPIYSGYACIRRYIWVRNPKAVRLDEKYPPLPICPGRREHIFEVGRQSRVGALEDTTFFAVRGVLLSGESLLVSGHLRQVDRTLRFADDCIHFSFVLLFPYSIHFKCFTIPFPRASCDHLVIIPYASRDHPAFFLCSLSPDHIRHLVFLFWCLSFFFFRAILSPALSL